MDQAEKTRIEERIVDVLKTVYDPEIPVDIWNLGMIYKVEVKEDGVVDLDMTFTAPNCPAADFIRSEEYTSELQSRQYLVCRLLLEKKNEYIKSTVLPELGVHV